jgi:F0F1-type ATP synthase assembly protein I
VSPQREKYSRVWAQAAYYASLGFILPAGVVAGYMIGWVLDRWLHTSPWLAVFLGFLGAAGGFVEIVILLKRGEKGGNGSGSAF